MYFVLTVTDHTPTEEVPGAVPDDMSCPLFHNSFESVPDGDEMLSTAESGRGPRRGDGVRGSTDNTIQTIHDGQDSPLDPKGSDIVLR